MSERPVSHRIDQLCDECKVIDKTPRHTVYDPAKGQMQSYCFPCATDLGVYDYSETISAAKKAGLDLIEYVTREM